METWVVAVVAALSFASIFLLVRLLVLRHTLFELSDELGDKLGGDTNTLVSISSHDKAARAFAADINRQLEALRAERLRLENGDAQLKAAIANVSHDIRTPLTAICGYLDLLEQEDLSDEQRVWLGVIRERATLMRSLTDELLEYSVVSSSADGFKPDLVDVKAVLEESVAGFYGVFVGKGIVPEIDMSNDAVVRLLDAGALRRVFDNILSNAAKYSNGDLRIELSDDGTVCFSNEASGLDYTQVQRLFDRFVTVENARGSFGLGLYIARLLTERMGGSISASIKGGRFSIEVCFC